jgi:hypothetical protein
MRTKNETWRKARLQAKFQKEISEGIFRLNWEKWGLLGQNEWSFGLHRNRGGILAYLSF